MVEVASPAHPCLLVGSFKCRVGFIPDLLKPLTEEVERVRRKYYAVSAVYVHILSLLYLNLTYTARLGHKLTSPTGILMFS